ncbi:RDD family protein, partial [bacterium]|nr:RDD family protein [bacterium]
ESESVRQKAYKKLEILSSRGDQKATELLARVSNLPNSILEISKQDQDVSSVSEALHSESTIIRMAALPKVCNSLKPEDAITKVYERLKIEREAKVIAKGLQSLSEIEGFEKEKIEILSYFLQNSEDHRVRADALESLAKHSEYLSAEIFLNLLQEDGNNRLIANALIALSNYENFEEKYKEAMMQALDQLCEDPNKFSQLSAIYCVGIINQDFLISSIEKIGKSSHLRVLLEAKSCLSFMAKENKNYQGIVKGLDVRIEELSSNLALGQILEIENLLQLKSRISFIGEKDLRQKSRKEIEREEKKEELVQRVRLENSNRKKKIIHKFNPKTDTANLNRRILAYGIDGFFMVLFTLFLMATPIVSLIQFLPGSNTILWVLSAWAYYVFFEYLDEFDCTPGKMIVGLSVVRGDGSFPSIKEASQRYFMRVFLSLPLAIAGDFFNQPILASLSALGALVPYASIKEKNNYQGLHDKVSNLYVIDVKKKPKKFIIWAYVALISIYVFIVMIFAGFGFLVASAQYSAKKQQKENQTPKKTSQLILQQSNEIRGIELNRMQLFAYLS